MQRVAFVMRVKEEQQEEYIQRHQEVLADEGSFVNQGGMKG